MLKLAGVPEHFNLPFHLVLDEGLAHFRWKDYPGGTGAMCQALRSGETDIAILLTEGIVSDQRKGNTAQIVSLYTQTPLLWGIFTGANQKHKSINELKGKTFAISRKGSGSHLMCYLLAQREGWDAQEVSFLEVGNLEGAKNALVNGDAAGFLWERFMTQPLVDAGHFRRLGEMPTPWPAFVIAVRGEVWQRQPEDVKHILETVMERARIFKDQHDAAEVISRRYGLLPQQAAQWLASTEWSGWQPPEEEMLADVVAFLDIQQP